MPSTRKTSLPYLCDQGFDLGARCYNRSLFAATGILQAAVKRVDHFAVGRSAADRRAERNLPASCSPGSSRRKKVQLSSLAAGCTCLFRNFIGRQLPFKYPCQILGTASARPRTAHATTALSPMRMLIQRSTRFRRSSTRQPRILADRRRGREIRYCRRRDSAPSSDAERCATARSGQDGLAR